jgi:hypothetical protein
MTGKRDNRIGVAFDCLNAGEEKEIVEEIRVMLS